MKINYLAVTYQSRVNNVSTKQLFAQFINTPTDKYLLTITAQTPEILSLPWELLQ